MRIMFIEFKLPYLLKDAEYPAGGYAVELLNWLNGFAEKKCQCGVLTWRGANDFIGKSFPFKLVETYPLGRGIRVLKYFYLHIPQLIRSARNFRPDVMVQAVSGLQTGMMAFVARVLRVPFVYRVASDMDADERYRSLMPGYAGMAYRYGLRQSSVIICQNRYQQEHFHERFPGKPTQILHNPLIPLGNINLLPRSKKHYVAWLGNFKPAKDMGLLLKVARGTPDIVYHVGGVPGKAIDQETLEAIDDLELLENVVFSGYVNRDRIAGFLAGAICLLNTSRYEGFSNTFLEAFSCGTPVVCPSRVDPDGIVSRKKLGYTAGKDEDLAEQVGVINRLSEHEHNGLSEQCRSYVLENHDLAQQTEKFMQIIASIETVNK